MSRPDKGQPHSSDARGDTPNTTSPETEFSSARLEGGWRYSFSKRQVVESLAANHASVAVVNFSMPEPHWRHSGFLISVYLHGNAQPAYSGEPDRASWTRLTIHALPEPALREVQPQLLVDALDSASAWIAHSRARGSAWLSSDRSWSAALADSRISIAET